MGAAELAALCHGISGVQEVVRSEILKQVTDQPLNEQRSDDGNGYVLGWILGLASHRGHRFEADQDQNGDRCLDEHVTEFVRHDDRSCGGMRQEVAGGIGCRVVDGEGDGLACGIEQGQRITGCVAHGRSVLGRGELIGIGGERLTVILEGGRAGRVAGAIAERQDAEDDQCGDLNDVDGKVDGSGCACAFGGNPCNEEGEEDSNQGHEERTGIGTAHFR